jgi:hypothetical protein
MTIRLAARNKTWPDKKRCGKLDLTVVSVGYLLPFPNGDFVRVACKSTKAVRDRAKKHKAFIALEEYIVCLVAANDQQHFQAPVQELILQHILPSPHYHEFCKD